MVSGINGVGNTGSVNSISQVGQTSRVAAVDTSLNSFDIEDKAIISSQAKLLNELDKFNSGQGDPVNLAVTRVMAENEVAANVNVIKAKNHMYDAVLGIGSQR